MMELRTFKQPSSLVSISNLPIQGLRCRWSQQLLAKAVSTRAPHFPSNVLLQPPSLTKSIPKHGCKTAMPDGEAWSLQKDIFRECKCTHGLVQPRGVPWRLHLQLLLKASARGICAGLRSGYDTAGCFPQCSRCCFFRRKVHAKTQRYGDLLCSRQQKPKQENENLEKQARSKYRPA